MFTLILIVIYIAFIGLGIPNSLFGAAWPAIYEDLGLSLSDANYITVLISGFTALAGLFSARVTIKFGVGRVTLACTALIGVALLGFSVSGNVWFMCLCAIPLGIATGVMDAALSNYIALHYKAIHMNLLHCFFGLGASLSLYLMSIMLEHSTWSEGYRTVALIQFAITAVVLAALPLWKKVNAKTETEEDNVQPRNISVIKMARMPSVRLVWLICVATNAIEGVCSVWGSTYLVFGYEFGVEEAAKALTLYTIGMTLGRFMAGLLSAKITGWRLIYLCSGIVFVSIIMMFVPIPAVAVTGLFLVGLGNGPIYPNIMYLAPQNFGKDISSSIIGSQMAAAYAGIMIAPPIFGYLAEAFDASLMPVYLIACFVLMILAIYFFVRRIGAEKK